MELRLGGVSGTGRRRVSGTHIVGRQRRIGQRKVGKHVLSAAFGHHVQLLASYIVLQAWQRRVPGHKIISAGTGPKFLKFRVIDKNVRRAWRIRSVRQVQNAAVQQQRRLVGVEEYRRIRVVMLVDDQLAFRRIQNRLSQRPRRQIGIEGHQRHPRRLEEQHHHQRGAHERPLGSRAEGADRADRRTQSPPAAAAFADTRTTAASGLPCVPATGCKQTDADVSALKMSPGVARSGPAPES